jgi:ABC-type uncharacterized transport system involved in gliding motility auxiliary subunit
MKFERRDVFSSAAWIGGALALAGLVRWSVQNEMTRVNEVLLIGGGVLFIAALVGNFREVAGFFGSRGGRLGTNTAALTLAFLAIVGLGNFLGFRHSMRWDWTPEKLYTLSDETKKVLGSLKEDVHFLRFDKAAGRDPLADTMAEYKKVSPRVTYQLVDPQERPDIARQYEVRRMGDIVVSSGVRTEHLKDSDEQSLTAGILKVTETRQKAVCFVTGHGERSLTASDGEGYSSAQKELERENYTVKPINLVESKEVPAECDVVVVAGPKAGYFPGEAEALEKYLAAGGKVLALVDPGTDPKLDPMLAPWNITLGNDLALDVSGAGQLFGLGAAVPVVTHYGAHPITEALESRMSFFPLARTVGAADKKNAQKPVTDLLLTSNRSFAKNNWDVKQKELKFEQGKDRAGPLTLGVAEESRENGKTGRLVVIGNSAFAANAFLTLQSNGDLFDNSVNWLAQDENLISIRPKSPTTRRVLLTVMQERLFYWFSLAMVPGIVLVAGVVMWWKRR